MEDNVYEKIHEQRSVPLTDESSFTMYSMNECYQVQNLQEQKNAKDHDSSRLGANRAKLELPIASNKKSASQSQMKKWLIVLIFAVVLLALVASVIAFALAVSHYRQPSKDLELTDKVNLLSSQINQMSMELETRLLNIDNLDNIMTVKLEQLKNETKQTEQELTNDINMLKVQHLWPFQDNVSQVVNDLNTVKSDLSLLQKQIYCGAGEWTRVAFLNMSDPSQQCPSAWRLETTSGVRACGRREFSELSCPSAFFSTRARATSEFNQVCGRVIAYQNNSPDGFHRQTMVNYSINSAYIDGVSITVTYEGTRHHIWSYAAGVTEASPIHTADNCPCSVENGAGPPSFVGDNYYCESGNPTRNVERFRSADKLWDGKQCEGTCCSGSKSPPWFSVHLPNATNESIEVRICGDESTENEDTPVELLEIYVQ